MKARRIFFGEIRDGRLARLPFLAWTILLMLIVIGFGLAIGAMIGILQNLMGGDPAETQATLEALFTTPFAIVLPVLGLGVLFVHYNLIAKRARDIGLPGWPTALAIALLTGLAGAALSESALGLINAVLGLALILVPGGAVGQPVKPG
ncbi:MAG: DUF805 domain-containing protein [Geminicoccaceae bacterium]|nr:DUF805 domain-containing protein [Geminicoccaceae bacterium]